MAAALAAPVVAAAAAAPASVTITILHTSDLHGRVDPRDSLADRDFGEGLARVVAAVRSIRAEGRPTLLLDSGDTIEGAPEQALAFSGGAAGSPDPIITAMNEAGYDAMAVGNHEFDFGAERLSKSRAQARFPFLSANVVREDGHPAFDPYAVREVAGARVGILGLTTPRVPSWESPSRIAGLRFLDSVEAARRAVSTLRQKERCDLIVVLAHEGFERDPETGADRGSAAENQAYALATEVPGIDVLLTGHTHSVIAPRKLGGAWVSQPGRFGKVLTRFDVTLDRAGGRWKVSRVQGSNLAMASVVPDPEIVRLASPSHDAAMAFLARQIARLPEPLSARNARTQDTAILDWLHQVQREQGRADLSFASLLPGSLPPWPAGPLTIRQVWSFYPYENTLVTVKATGRQVREALEVAARCISGVEASGDGFAWRRNPAVWGYNCDTLDGAEYALDPARPEGHRLLFLRRGGRPVGDDEVFLVAINSYRAAGGGGYAVWRNCPRVAETEKSLRDLLVEDARRRGELAPRADENWFLAPSLPEGPMRASGG
ncbi:MAG: bifunctional metallophosphatase/5'-nucleotidase [Acidobacteriota bacterium]